MEASSAFDGLPRELIWSIFDYAPGKLFDIRLASRSTKSLVDEYTLTSRSHQFVDELELIPQEINDEKTLKIVMKIHDDVLSTFKLRLIQTPGFTDKTERSGNQHIFHYASMDDSAAFEHLSLCMGRRIGSLNDRTITDIGWSDVVSVLLSGKRISALEIITHTLTEDIVNRILKTVSAHEVYHISLYTKTVAPSNASQRIPAQFGFVCPVDQDLPTTVDGHFLWGTINLDWAQIILEMFSKNVKRLILDNGYYPLPRHIVNNLIENLPQSGKKVWFEENCEEFESNNQAYERNEYKIETSNDYDIGALRIMHASVANDQSESGNRGYGLSSGFMSQSFRKMLPQYQR